MLSFLYILTVAPSLPVVDPSTMVHLTERTVRRSWRSWGMAISWEVSSAISRSKREERVEKRALVWWVVVDLWRRERVALLVIEFSMVDC